MISILRAVALSTALASFVLVGCEKPPENLIESAKGYLNSKDSKAAIIQLKSALQQQPDLPEARYLLGRALLDTGNAVDAEVELNKALKLRASAAQVLPLLAQSLVLQGKNQQVIEEYARVSFTDPVPRAHMRTALATAYSGIGKRQEAYGAVAEALDASADFGPALLVQARLNASDGDYNSAHALLDKVLAKEPDNYQALHFKGSLLYFVQHDNKAALEAQRKALSFRKDWIPAHSSILHIALAARDTKAYKEQLQQLKEVAPGHPYTKYFQTLLAIREKDFGGAKELLQQLLNVAPDSVNLLLLASNVELQMGFLPSAEGLAKKALQRAPELADSRHLLAQIHLREGQAGKAQEALDPLLQRVDVEAKTLVLAAQIALQSGNPGRAEAYFGRASKLNPQDRGSRTALALVQLSKGNGDLGFSQLQDIAVSDAGTDVEMAIISAQLRQKNYDEALETIDALQRKQPGSPMAHLLRAQVYLAKKDPAAARRSFEKAASLDPLYFPAVAGLAALDLREKQPERASKRFDKLLAADPNNIQALLAKIELRTQAGANKEEVIRLLLDVIKRNPREPTPRLLLIELHLRAQDPKAAMSASEDAVAAIPGNPIVLDYLGRSQMAANDPERAVATFRKLSALQPRSTQSHMRLAEAQLAIKNIDAARQSLNRAVDLNPKYLPAHRGLVMVELGAGRPEQAMAAARRVQKELPDQYVGYLFAGDIEASRKNWGAAASAYRAGLARGNPTELAAKLHKVLISDQKQAEARSFAATWLKEHPNDAEFLNHLGDLALTRLDFTDAETQYLAVVKLQPNNANALNNLAWLMHKLKKPGASVYAEKAIALRPGQPAFMDTLASILADEGQLSKAIELEKKAVAAAPHIHSFRLSLAKLYLRAGQKVMAKAELDHLASLGDKFPGQAEVKELLRGP